jgi:drug/metabolite transporter (DMT)-like permease
MLTFFAGLARTGPSTASILSTFEPVVTTTLAALTLHEFLAPVQVVGALLVLASVAVIQLPRQRTHRVPRGQDDRLGVELVSQRRR